jgi:hypothetical protein
MGRPVAGPDEDHRVTLQLTGLPRSGTAFIATMLALNPRCIAYHDVISFEEDWRGVLGQAGWKHDWVADVGTYQYLPKATDAAAVKVFIDRPPFASRKAAEEAFGFPLDPMEYKRLSAIADDWVATHRPLVVNYSTLWNVQSMESIWRHCFGDDVAFPEEKVRLLLLNNIQRHEPAKWFGPESLSLRIRELF